MNNSPGLSIDLHIHTSFSDGTLTPAQIVRYALKTGLNAIAITDHDNTDGILPAVKEGAKTGIEIIPGIELSAEFEEDSKNHEIHMLGYFIDWENEGFRENVRIFREERKQRALRILDKFKKLGIRIDEEYLHSPASGASGESGSIGRLHFARSLVNDGIVRNITEAFQKYLGFGKPAYEPKFKLSPEDAIKMILDVSGIPVIAHPYYGSFDSRKLIERLSKAGMLGVEVWHSKQPASASVKFLDLAKEFNLLATGGSDFHGTTADDTPAQKIPYSVLEALKEYKRRQTLKIS